MKLPKGFSYICWMKHFIIWLVSTVTCKFHHTVNNHVKDVNALAGTQIAGQGLGQLVPLEGAGWGRLALASLAELRAGSGPAQAMAGQVQGPIAPGWGRGACFQGRRQGGRVGGEALEQQLAQSGLVAPQGLGLPLPGHRA